MLSQFLKENESKVDRIIFNAVKDLDNEIYRNLVSLYKSI